MFKSSQPVWEVPAQGRDDENVGRDDEGVGRDDESVGRDENVGRDLVTLARR
ncbi:hypothetical protein [Alteromonas lipolytica]|uniref:hypothetical protein n=1 Tax=Alteromonas lipolytica TaxID=1856405 RepID=UPI001586F532|nr:hypothetical protein [Alteromonas lipolytica]GGF67827.1 hypothetical protein GCM10011338_20020 [Alteromonas lipolytica]